MTEKSTPPTLTRRAFVSGVAAAAIGVALSGCSPQAGAQGGKTVEVCLPYNAGTGYAWTCETNNTVLELQQVSTVELGQPNQAGGPLEDHFVLAGKKAGKDKATFRLSRGWETSDSDKTVTYEFEVGSDLSIKLTGESGEHFDNSVRFH